MTARFMLEIYEHDSFNDVDRTFERNEPFHPIACGDLIHLVADPGGTPEFFGRVVNIEHILWEASGELRHKVCVFTTAAEDPSATRLARHKAT